MSSESPRISQPLPKLALLRNNCPAGYRRQLHIMLYIKDICFAYGIRIVTRRTTEKARSTLRRICLPTANQDEDTEKKTFGFFGVHDKNREIFGLWGL